MVDNGLVGYWMWNIIVSTSRCTANEIVNLFHLDECQESRFSCHLNSKNKTHKDELLSPLPTAKERSCIIRTVSYERKEG